MKSKQKTNSGNLVPISSTSIKHAYFFVLTHWKTFWALMRYLKIVILDFFLLQFTVKWGWRKIEIINVDHRLDEEVPFVPSLATVYLDFINFWVRPLAFVCLRLKRRSIPYVVQYLNLIADVYAQASTFYTFKMTTTKRPTNADYRDKNFDAIRRLDPHYLCVPSLHVSVVVLAAFFYKDFFEKEGFSQEEKDFYNKELYAGAVEIAETVLYVKQHSVNCIPAALYMMTDALSDLFTIQDAIDFIDVMFVNQTNITPEAKTAINVHLHMLFEQLLLEGKYSDHWLEPLKRWLLKYQSGEYRI